MPIQRPDVSPRSGLFLFTHGRPVFPVAVCLLLLFRITELTEDDIERQQEGIIQ